LPPTAEQLKELLNCCFAASLETEEGRCAAFTVSFFGGQERVFPYQLKELLSLTPRDLVRLSVALDPSRARICVVPGKNGLEVAGFVHLGEQESVLGGRQTLSQLSIRVLGPGILLLRYADHLVFTYRRGTFAFHAGDLENYPRRAVLDEWGVGNLLTLRRRAGNAEELTAILRFEGALTRIARIMLRQRHGGTLLILPERVNWEAAASSKRYAPAWPVVAVKSAHIRHMGTASKRVAGTQEQPPAQTIPEADRYWLDLMIRSQYVAELDWLGRLTATDGMTVILPDLTLLGFGVFFETREEPQNPTRVVVIDQYDETTELHQQAVASIGGARHQSAALTCRRFPGATAIVASQDGSLTSMKWNDEASAVVAYRHLELLLDV
jgi:hypothetical protein